MLTHVDAEQKATASKNRGFAAWQAKPETRLLISQIPSGDNKETLDVLLRSAFKGNVTVDGEPVEPNPLTITPEPPVKQGVMWDGRVEGMC